MNAEQFAALMQSQQTLITALMTRIDADTQQQQGRQTDRTAVNTALLPNFDTFDQKKESFRTYKRRFENYTEMKNISTNEEYCAKLLLNSIGAKNFDIIASLAAPKEPKEFKYQELIDLLEQHLAPKKNVLVAQHQFLSKYQDDNQSIAEFVAALRTDIGDCEFISPCECKISTADTFLRAQFIRGLKDNSIREKLLQTKAKTFNEIVSEAIALESSKADSRKLSQNHSTANQPTASTAHADINKVTHHVDKQRQRQNRSRQRTPRKRHQTQSRRGSQIDYARLGIGGLCLRCGRNNHCAKDCRIEQSTLSCSGCKKTGHVAKVCIRTLLGKKSTSTSHSTNHIDEPEIQYSAYNIVDIYQNQATDQEADRYYVHVDIEGNTVQFEVDSGSGFTFLPRDQFKKLKLNTPLLPTPAGFRSYTKNVFVPDGKINVNITYKNKVMQDEIYIVPEDYSALLGRTWIRRLGIELSEVDTIRVSPTVTRINQLNIDFDTEEIMKEFTDVFEEKIGCVPNLKIKLKLREGATPIFHREREIPFALRDIVEAELISLEKQGIISKTESSDWGSPLVVIPKANGGVRLCVDYKIGVNQRIVDAHYPARKITDILNSLKNSRYFCRLDLYKAYLHIQVDEESSKIQTISTHRGTFKVNRLSFGVKNGPADFNAILDQIIRGLKGVEKYFDDFLVHGTTFEECKMNLIALLERLRRFDLHLNRRKCELFTQRIEFLGHVVEYNKISKSPAKVEAISIMPEPESVDEVRRFLGMVTYYSRFIPDASTITAPLRKLLQKGAKFKWSQQCREAFKKLKEEITNDRVLIPFDPALPVQLTCDASPVGIAGILSHVVDGQERPIAFASRSLTPAEQNYSQLDREALAIVYSVDHFHQYIFGRPFKLITDNKPLVHIFHQHAKLPKMTSARLQRYAAFLSGFDYQVAFKRGTENLDADCLSRAPIKMPVRPNAINNEVHSLCETSIQTISALTLTHETVRSETRTDENLSKILDELLTNSASGLDYTLDDGIIFKGQRVVIPRTLQDAVLQELHSTHIGMTKMKQLARRYIYWKSIDSDIEAMVRSCQACALTRNSPAKAPLHPWTEPEHNWQRIHIDYAGPTEGHHFLVVMDAKSKWAEISSQTAAPTSRSTLEILQDIFARNGFPDVMVSDNATIFTSEIFTEYCKNAGIFQKFIAPGHPATNGLAERNVQTLKNRLEAMENERKPMRAKVREILFKYRSTPLQNGKTPAEQYLNRQIRIQLDALKPPKFQVAMEPTQPARQLSVGDRVQARYYSTNKTTWKFGTITKKFGQLHYQIELDDGYKLKRHIDQLRITRVLKPNLHTPTTPTFKKKSV